MRAYRDNDKGTSAQEGTLGAAGNSCYQYLNETIAEITIEVLATEAELEVAQREVDAAERATRAATREQMQALSDDQVLGLRAAANHMLGI